MNSFDGSMTFSVAYNIVLLLRIPPMVGQSYYFICAIRIKLAWKYKWNVVILYNVLTWFKMLVYMGQINFALVHVLCQG